MFATVDLGSNSFRLQIYQDNQGQAQIIDDMKQMVRLAAGLDESKFLDEDSQQRALACLQQFRERLRGFAPERVRVVATNTFRVAKNIRQFLPKAEKALGFPIEVIAGREEARLIYTGVVHAFPNNGAKMLVVDIGGGSTELIIGADLQPLHLVSLPLGCVSYSMQFFPNNKVNMRQFLGALHTARGEIQRIAKGFKREGWEIAVGTSGTAKTLANVIAHNCPTLAPEGGITLLAMEHLAWLITEAGSVKKAKLAHLKPERAEILLGGLAVMVAVFKELEIREMRFAPTGLRDGVFFDMIGRSLPDDMREETVRQFQERYRVSKKQAKRVAQVALQCFASLGLDDKNGVWRRYLRWAAMLHEVGLEISYTAYHKHTAYILEQADMGGFSRSEQEILANLTIGQRGSLKKLLGLLGDNQMLWHAVFALRLAVLLCRGRLPLVLPENTRLVFDEEGYQLHIAKIWLEENPLTASALYAESKQWANSGKKFEIVLLG